MTPHSRPWKVLNALDRLGALAPRKTQVVELPFFGGLSTFVFSLAIAFADAPQREEPGSTQRLTRLRASASPSASRTATSRSTV